MKDLIDNLTRKTQDLEKRLQILNLKFSSFIPELGDNEDLSSAVANIQSNIKNITSELTSIQNNLTTLNLNYGGLVESDANNQVAISILQEQMQHIPNNLDTTIYQIQLDLRSYENNLTTLEEKCNQVETNLTSQINNVNSTLSSQINNVANNVSDSIFGVEVLANNYTDTSIENLKTELTNEITELNTKIDNLVVPSSPPTQSTNIDNELYFILQGTYLSPDDLTNLLNGNYTI